MKLVTGCLVAILLLVVAACNDEPKVVLLDLASQEGSSQFGTATLTDIDNRTQVELSVTVGPPGNDPQPVHVHFGRCGANLGNVRYSLNSVVAGESVTIIDVSFSDLRDGNSAINLHKSIEEISIYTACGNVPIR